MIQLQRLIIMSGPPKICASVSKHCFPAGNKGHEMKFAIFFSDRKCMDWIRIVYLHVHHDSEVVEMTISKLHVNTFHVCLKKKDKLLVRFSYILQYITIQYNTGKGCKLLSKFMIMDVLISVGSLTVDSFSHYPYSPLRSFLCYYFLSHRTLYAYMV